MTTPADDTAVEDAFEAYLAGRPVPEEAAGLAVFAAAVRATAAQPGRPSAALAELLATGLLADQSSPSTRTARSAGAPPSRRGSRARNRRRFAMIFPVLLAKLLSAGAVAQAATGVGVVIVVATGAGATGVLGSEVQDTITAVVAPSGEVAPSEEESTAPDENVASEEALSTGGIPTPAETTVPVAPTADEFDPAAWEANGPEEDQPFGEWVSESAHNRELRDWLRAEGRNFGSIVREWAHKNGVSEKELDLDELIDGETGPTPSTEPSDDVTAPVPAEVEPAQTAEDDGRDDREDRGDRGNGNGNKNGNGGGKGNGRD